MTTLRSATRWMAIAIAALLLSGCATRTVVVPAKPHAHSHGPKHVVYAVKPAKKHCWRHRGHWDCR